MDELDEVIAELDASPSWRPLDLEPVLAGEPPAPPAYLVRSDGVGLLYRPGATLLYGEPESGKTWLALLVCRERIAAGERVLYVDLENTPAAIVERLRALGLSDAEILEGFCYVRPTEPLRGELEIPEGVTFGSVDAVTELMHLHGLDAMSATDWADVMRRFVRPLTDAGAAALLLDHVTKDAGTRGRWAYGTQHKLASVDAAFRLEVLRAFGRGLEGAARIEVTKDRAGHVRAAAIGGRVAAELRVRASVDGLEVRLEAPSAPWGNDELSPSRRRVLAVLGGPEEPATVREIGDRLATDGEGPPLKKRTILDALDDLLSEGLVDGERPGSGLPSRWWRTP